LKYYFRLTSAIWCLFLLTWPLTWSLHDFSDSYTGDSTGLFLLFEYLTWSAYLYPLYVAGAIYLGAKLLKRQAMAPLTIMVSMLPFLSAAPYVGLSLVLALLV